MRLTHVPASVRGWFSMFALVLALIAGSASCGDDPVIIRELTETITAAEGGMMQFRDVILIFEPGDLAADTEITIRDEGLPPQGRSAMTRLYSFEPEGLVFAGEIRVCFEFEANPNIAGVSALYWTNLNSTSFSRETFEEGFGPVPGEEDLWRRCADITHFSRGYLGNADLNPNGASDADVLFEGIDVQVNLIADDRNATGDMTFTDGESYEIIVDDSGSVLLPGDMEDLSFQFDPNIDRFETEFDTRVTLPEDGLMATVYREWGVLQIIRVGNENPEFCLMLDEMTTWDFPEDNACTGIAFGDPPDPDGGGSMTGSGASAFFAANAADYMYVADDTADSGDMTFTETNTYTISVTAGGMISVEDDAMNTISFTFDEMTDIFDEAMNETNVIIAEGSWQVIMQKPTGQPVEFFLSVDPPMLGGPNWNFAPAPL